MTPLTLPAGRPHPGPGDQVALPASRNPAPWFPAASTASPSAVTPGIAPRARNTLAAGPGGMRKHWNSPAIISNA